MTNERRHLQGAHLFTPLPSASKPPPPRPLFSLSPTPARQGLEESLAFLGRVWDEQGPFDGLLGFSQGAAMASIFNHCAFASRGGACGDGGGEGGHTERENRLARAGDPAVS